MADIILNRRLVYGLDVDSLIREAANRLTARALFEMLAKFDPSAPNFREVIREIVDASPDALTTGAVDVLVRFDDGMPRLPDGDEQPMPPHPVNPSVHHLKLVFRDEAAARYQFHLFPNLEAPYILGGSQKREGPVQHLRLELSQPEALQAFIDSCRHNPHLLRVEESSAGEFEHAPSHSV